MWIALGSFFAFFIALWAYEERWINEEARDAVWLVAGLVFISMQALGAIYLLTSSPQ